MGMPKFEFLAIALVVAAIIPFPISMFYMNKNMFSSPSEIRIIIKQWEFMPNEIVVTKGQTVTLMVTSEDVLHGFQMTEYGINAMIKPGEPVRLEFVADKAGEFFYRCFIPCGAGHSTIAHSGKFIVEENAPPGSLQVFVKNANGTALAGATVTISGPVNAEGTTDSNGQYTFNEITIGDYSIRAMASGYGTTSSPATVTSGETKTVTVVLTPAVVKEFHIEAWIQEKGGFKVQESLDSKTITVNQGDTVRLVVTAMDVAHSLVIHDFDVDTDYIAKGKTATVEFTATKSGTFTYDCMIYCSPQHPDMKGTLIVNP